MCLECPAGKLANSNICLTCEESIHIEKLRPSKTSKKDKGQA